MIYAFYDMRSLWCELEEMQTEANSGRENFRSIETKICQDSIGNTSSWSEV